MQYVKPEIRLSVLAGGFGNRFCLPVARQYNLHCQRRVLIHRPAQGAQGQASDIAIIADEIDRMNQWLIDTLAEHTGQDPEQIKLDIARDKILSAEQAKDYGIVDQVLTSRKKSPQAIEG